MKPQILLLHFESTFLGFLGKCLFFFACFLQLFPPQPHPHKGLYLKERNAEDNSLNLKVIVILLKDKEVFRDCPGSPVVKTLRFQGRAHEFDPSLVN